MHHPPSTTSSSIVAACCCTSLLNASLSHHLPSIVELHHCNMLLQITAQCIIRHPYCPTPPLQTFVAQCRSPLNAIHHPPSSSTVATCCCRSPLNTPLSHYLPSIVQLHCCNMMLQITV